MFGHILGTDSHPQSQLLDATEGAIHSVAELFASLANQTFDPDSIVATIRLANKEAGAAFHGLVASRLPPGAIDTLRPSSQSNAPETFSVQLQTAVPLQRFLAGRDTVRVHIRPVLR